MRIRQLFTSGLSARRQQLFHSKLVSGKMRWFTKLRVGSGSACPAKVVSMSDQQGDHPYAAQAEPLHSANPAITFCFHAERPLAPGR